MPYLPSEERGESSSDRQLEDVEIHLEMHDVVCSNRDPSFREAICDCGTGLLCVSVDVISRFGFKKDFGAVRSFGGGDGRHEFLDVSLSGRSAPLFLPRGHVALHAL